MLEIAIPLESKRFQTAIRAWTTALRAAKMAAKVLDLFLREDETIAMKTSSLKSHGDQSLVVQKRLTIVGKPDLFQGSSESSYKLDLPVGDSDDYSQEYHPVSLEFGYPLE